MILPTCRPKTTYRGQVLTEEDLFNIVMAMDLAGVPDEDREIEVSYDTMIHLISTRRVTDLQFTTWGGRNHQFCGVPLRVKP